jgi:hypothetical protein
MSLPRRDSVHRGNEDRDKRGFAVLADTPVNPAGEVKADAEADAPSPGGGCCRYLDDDLVPLREQGICRPFDRQLGAN